MEDSHDPASMRTASSPNLGGGGSYLRRLSVECRQYQAKAAGDQPLHLQHEGALHQPEYSLRPRRLPSRSKSSATLGASQGLLPAAAFPFKYAESSYLPEPLDSPRSLVRKQGSRLSTVLSWKMSKRSSTSSPVVGGPEEPGALGFHRSSTWDQMSPGSEPPSLPISRCSSYASYGASSIDDVHSPLLTAHSQGCVMHHHNQQAGHAPMVQPQLLGPHEYKGPSTRSQPLMPSRAHPGYARSASASRRLSSGPVCPGEAPGIGSMAQHHTHRSVGSVRGLVRSISATSRRSSYVAGSVLEAEGPSSGSVYAGEGSGMGSVAQQCIPRSVGSARGLARSISATGRRSSYVAGSVSEAGGPSSGPVYAGEASGMGSVAQQYIPRCVGSARGLARSVSATSRRSSYVAGSVSEAEGPSSESVYAGEASGVGSAAQQYIPRSVSSARGLARSISATRRGSYVAGCVPEVDSPTTHACSAKAPTIGDGRQVLDSEAFGGPTPSLIPLTQGHRSRRSSLYDAECASAAPSSRATASADCLPRQPPAHPYLLPSHAPSMQSKESTCPGPSSSSTWGPSSSTWGPSSGTDPLSSSSRCQEAHSSSHLLQNQPVMTADDPHHPPPDSRRTPCNSGQPLRPTTAPSPCSKQQASHSHSEDDTFSTGSAAAGSNAPRATGSAAAAAASAAGATGSANAAGSAPRATGSAAPAGSTARAAQAGPPQKPAVLEGRPKGWKALSFTKSKLFRSFMP
ncbi:hypothetical protein DUNSADRAFT_10379 [Dunaliella salina]|uniref:Uncharacterized protein n=1 Tax=Dunaliella salina TaxID=3046 RepID=A0ABQ7GFJ7_DUNSA|nr:hypothetical protein DUNSADRAFT_10379 [Dunaliella salina]|eukprot:KAF5833376.1 hypothetical protein DUNSADRAFT_10379 [Dunaliella salina]